jgi:hypothetical protein
VDLADSRQEVIERVFSVDAALDSVATAVDLFQTQVPQTHAFSDANLDFNQVKAYCN